MVCNQSAEMKSMVKAASADPIEMANRCIISGKINPLCNSKRSLNHIEQFDINIETALIKDSVDFIFCWMRTENFGASEKLHR